jgi:hypothetical protein
MPNDQLIMLSSDAMVDREGEQEGIASETIVGNLVELSRKTGLVVRRPDSTAVKTLSPNSKNTTLKSEPKHSIS